MLTNFILEATLVTDDSTKRLNENVTNCYKISFSLFAFLNYQSLILQIIIQLSTKSSMVCLLNKILALEGFHLFPCLWHIQDSRTFSSL